MKSLQVFLKGKQIKQLSGQVQKSFSLQPSFYQYPILDLPTDPKQEKFAENREAMTNLNNEYQTILQKILKGGPERAQQNLQKKNKLPVRERINKILDPGSPFLELSQLAGYELYGNEEVPAGGIITGVGLVHNKFCMIVANDSTVKAGTYYPITVKKHLRAQEIAKENNLPCIYLVDSGGANLPRQDDVFPDKEHFGRIFFNQANMSAQGIPQVSIVLGSCTAGGAYVPAMSDESVIVKGNGTIFLGGPPLVKAATGEVVTSEDLGGADVHCRTSGVTDHFARDEIEALQMTRQIIANLNVKEASFNLNNIEEPLYESDTINDILNPDLRKTVDSRYLISRLVDGSRFHEFKKNYGETLITGFSKLYGQDVGIVANNGILFSESALKGAHFIELCSQRKIPLLFLQNITGFMIGKKYENEGIAKNGAKLVNAVSTTQVPKLTLLFGGSFGAGNYGMCGRAYSPRFLFSLPHSKISVMGGEQAAGVLTTVKKAQLEKAGKQYSKEEEDKTKKQVMQMYDKQGSIYYASSRLWDDGVILPNQIRQQLGLSLLISLNKPIPDSNGFGVFRM